VVTEKRIEGFSLSPQQRRLCTLGAGPGGAPYRAECAILIGGALDAAALGAALHKVVERYEILRTEFRRLPAMTLPLQVVSDAGGLSLTHAPAREGADVAALVEEFASRNGFHDAGDGGPNLRAVLQTLGPDSHLLLLSFPALCMDTEAMPGLLREIASCYAACAHGEPLPGVKFHYADLSGWMNGLLRDEEASEERDYWRRRCSDRRALTRARLPFEREAVADAPLNPQYVTMKLDAAPEAASLAERLGVSLSAVLLSCWLALLQRFTGEGELVLGLSSGGRGYEGLDGALGLFEKCLPLECRVNSRADARDFIRSVAEAQREAHELQEFFSWDEEGAGTAGVSFIPYCFSFYRNPEPLRVGGLSLSLYRGHCDTDRFRLKLVVGAGAGGELDAEFRYDADAFRRADVERLAAAFSAMLRSVAADPASAVGDLGVVDGEERRRLVQEFNYTRRDFRPARLLHQLFEERARRHPEQVAVVSGENRLSYAELNAGANRLARHLRALGVGPGAVIPVCLERSADAILSLLGILKAGAAYAALDPAQPDERLSLMLGELEPPLALTHERFAPLFERAGVPVVCVDRDRDVIAPHDDSDVENVAAAADLCYVLFTSGSTGRPKGVAVEHRQVLNYLHAITAKLSLGPGATYATVSTLAADLGNTAIFPSLTSGGCLHLIPTDVSLSPEAFAAYVSRHGIDCLKIVPSHLEVLLTAPDPARVLPERRLVLGGEASRPHLVERVRKLKPGCAVLNHYGPSETTVGVLTLNADPSRGEAVSATVPLGYPLANTQVYVLDAGMRPMPVWMTGELYIGGAQVSRGYLGHPGLTAERFVPNPFSAEPGARLYRTGDAARFLPDYSIEFLGRIDFQVKIRGYRIEIEEVEAALCSHPSVERAVVLAQGQGTGEARLVAYIVARGPELTADQLKGFLAKKLPDYMLPSSCFVLPSLPLTPNGKVDRRALAGGRYAHLEMSARAVSPRNEAERTVAEIWQEVLGLDRVGVYDNFFDLGGHSLLLAKVHARLKQAFDRHISVIDLFKYSTVGSLSEFLTKEQAGPQPARFDKLFDRVGKQREAINRQRQRLKEREQ
jgi:amino acid adenylation domain-containing protein